VTSRHARRRDAVGLAEALIDAAFERGSVKIRALVDRALQKAVRAVPAGLPELIAARFEYLDPEPE
jgi:hypothetical protein